MHLFCRHARFISTRVRHSRSSLLLEKLQQETDDPLWRFLVAMRHSINFRAGRVLVPDYDRWKPLANMGGLAKAVEAMEGKPGPLWLAMYLLAFKIRAHDDAYPAAFDLAYAHLPFAPRQFRGPLLILTAGALSRFDLLLPIRRIVDEFLNADLASHSELYFNLFIQALTVTPSETTEIAQAIVKLLRRMDARKLKLSKETYDLLLNDKLVNIHLAHYLRHHMTRNNVVPTTAQLEAYLRIFAKKGTAEEASDIHSAIHHRVVTPHDLNHEDAILLATQRNQAEYPLDRTNKLLLSVRADPSLAQDYLEKLLNPAFNLQPKTFSLKSLDLNKSQPFIIPKHSHPDIHAFTSALTALVADEQVSAQVLVNTFEKARDVRDLRPNEVAYTVLMRGLYKRKDYLTAMKYWSQYYQSGLPMDRHTLGVGMRILTRIGNPHEAFWLLQQWAYRLNLEAPRSKEIEEELEPADQGPQVGENEPQVDEPENDLPSDKALMKATTHPFHRVSVSIITLNDWMVALNRIERPDAVLAAWDALRPVYNVSPDARSLAILLGATRQARRLDNNSVKAVVMRMKYGLRDTFRVPQPGSQFPGELTATVAQKNLEEILGPMEKSKPRKYTPKLWHGRLPEDHARMLFLQAVFGAAPDPRALMAVEAPAIATRKTPPGEDDEESWVGLNVGLPKWKEGVDTWEPPEWEELLIKRKRRVSGTPEETAQLHTIERIWEEEEEVVSKVPADEGITEYWDSYHPSIIPTSEAFLHYILLLGLTGRASEIARVLAWMRHLKITPSRSTLGASLALWGEVSGRALLIETIVRRRKEKKQKLAATQKSEEIVDEPPWMRGPLGAYARDIVELADEEKKERVAADLEAPEEYQKLVDWLCEWVPLHLMPGPRSLATWTRNIWRLREGGVWEAEEAISETQHIEERVDFR